MATSTVNTVFSKEFYTQRMYSSDAHTAVDTQGTFKVVPFNFFTRFINGFKRFFKTTQNADLIAAHKRLKELQVQIQNPSSSELKKLKEEIHSEYMKGGKASGNALISNLWHLSCAFQRGNRAAAGAYTLLKVVNHVRSFFKYKPIERYHYTPIDIDPFQTKAIIPAQVLTEQERRLTKHSFLVRCIETGPETPTLDTRDGYSEEQMHQLELGVIKSMRVNETLAMSYDKTKGKFSLSKLHSIRDEDKARPDAPYQTTPVTVIEKKADGTVVNHTLQSTHKWTQGSWLPWRYPTLSYETNSVELTANSEYTIPMCPFRFGRVEWNLQITMALRTPQ